MSNLLKKLTLSFLSVLIFFFSLAPYFSIAKAQTTETWYSQGFKTWFAKVSDPSNPSEIFGERYTSAQVEWVIYGIFAFFVNQVAPPGTAGACVNGDIVACTVGIKEFFDSIYAGEGSSQINSNKSLASLVFTVRPLSGISYIRGKIRNFSLVPTVQAQTVGFGFDALKPIQEMWKASRDIAFGLFVLTAVIFAFMIMFRVKLSPQLVISVQSALPKVFMALILATFSYAIAGFVIDLSCLYKY